MGSLENTPGAGVPPPESKRELDSLLAQVSSNAEFRSTAPDLLRTFSQQHLGRFVSGTTERHTCIEFHAQVNEGFFRERENSGFVQISPRPRSSLLALYRFGNTSVSDVFPDAHLIGMVEFRDGRNESYELARPLIKGIAPSFQDPALNLAVISHAGELSWHSVLSHRAFEQTKLMLDGILGHGGPLPGWFSSEVELCLNQAIESGKIELDRPVKLHATSNQPPGEKMIGIKAIREVPGTYYIDTWFGEYTATLELGALLTPTLTSLETYGDFRRRFFGEQR